MGVKTEWLADGRNMRLLERLDFRDRSGRLWFAPKGAVVNGASIPWFFRRAVGCPFSGQYRDASVLHDYHCDIQFYHSVDVHHMFWEKMRSDGVGPCRAWIMWAAVRWFGPRF